MPINSISQLNEKIIPNLKVNEFIRKRNEFLWKNPYIRSDSLNAKGEYLIKKLELIKENKIPNLIFENIKDYIKENFRKYRLPLLSELPDRRGRVNKDGKLPGKDLVVNPLTSEEILRFRKDVIIAFCGGLSNIINWRLY